MRKRAFLLLAWINKRIFPSYIYRDLQKLGTIDKAIIGFRYWVTINALSPDKE